LAQVNSRLSSRSVLAMMASFRSGWWRSNFEGRTGFWLYDVMGGCYTFFPFAYGWGSPYGTSYGNSLYGAIYGMPGSRPGWSPGSGSGGSSSGGSGNGAGTGAGSGAGPSNNSARQPSPEPSRSRDISPGPAHRVDVP
jgi:hypothetical protein